MSKVLIKNGLIVTMDSDRRIIEGSVSVDGDEIQEVGEVDDQDFDDVIDAEGKIVTPGLVSTHTRPYRVFLQSAPLSLNGISDYMQLLQRVWWPMDEKLSIDEVYLGTLAAGLQFIRTGVTFISAIHSSQESIGKSLDEVSNALEEVGLKGIIGFEASERHTRAEGARGMRENVRFLENLEKKRNSGDNIRGMVCLSSSINASNELLRHGNRVSESFDVPLTIPAGIGKTDLHYNLNEHGKRTLERFRDVGILSQNTILTNGFDLDREDLDIIEKSGAKLSYDPCGGLLNSLGVPPVSEMKERNIEAGIGNGGFCFDGFENLRHSYLIHGLSMDRPIPVTPMEILEMTTIKGAKLYGVEEEIGSIEPGKKADMVIIDPSSIIPTQINRSNVVDYLVKSAQGRDVETVLIDGKIVVKNGSIKTLDEKRVIDNSKETAKKIWKKLENLKR